MRQFSRRGGSVAFILFAAFAIQMPAALAADNQFEKYFSFSNDTAKPLPKRAHKFKEWKHEEQQIVERLLKQAEALSPQLIERACAVEPLKLARCDRYYVQDDRAWLNMPHLAIAVADTDRIIFCDSFFADTDERKLLATLLHELTHEADMMRRVSFTQEWMEYFSKNFRVEYRNYEVDPEDPNYKPFERNLCEGLANTYSSYLLGKKIPDKEYFEKKIVPILLCRSSPDELTALRNYFAAEISFRNVDLVSARLSIEKTIDLLPTAIKPSNMLLFITSKLGASRVALIRSEKCIQLMDDAKLPSNEPERIAVYGTRAWLLASEGDYLEAKRLINMCLEIRPSDECLIQLLQYCNKQLEHQQNQATKDIT